MCDVIAVRLGAPTDFTLPPALVIVRLAVAFAAGVVALTTTVRCPAFVALTRTTVTPPAHTTKGRA